MVINYEDSFHCPYLWANRATLIFEEYYRLIKMLTPIACLTGEWNSKSHDSSFSFSAYNLEFSSDKVSTFTHSEQTE